MIALNILRFGLNVFPWGASVLRGDPCYGSCLRLVSRAVGSPGMFY